jgi:hypothetical protein
MNKTKIDDVVDFLKKFAGDDGIPVINGTDWEEMNNLFKKEEIKEGMAEYVLKYSVLFPCVMLELLLKNIQITNIHTQHMVSL